MASKRLELSNRMLGVWMLSSEISD